MSTIITFELRELKKLTNDKKSCVIEKKVTQNLALQPWCLGKLKESIKNVLDYKIGKFDKDFNGILLSYKNLRTLQNVGAIRNDNADIHFQVQADYFIFQPYVGATLKGIVNKKSTTHLGILVHRVFNVVIPRPTEQPGDKWIGTSIQEGQEVIFRIVVLDLYGALPYIRGELDERWMKLGPDGDDELIEVLPAEPINVSYVNFDKTKPSIQKQSGDGIIQTSSKSMSKQTNNSKKTGSPVHRKSNPKLKNDDSPASEVNSTVEKKAKKSKIDSIPMEPSPKQNKKHKKDVL